MVNVVMFLRNVTNLQGYIDYNPNLHGRENNTPLEKNCCYGRCTPQRVGYITVPALSCSTLLDRNQNHVITVVHTVSYYQL
jgi:hypothetical protein